MLSYYKVLSSQLKSEEKSETHLTEHDVVLLFFCNDFILSSRDDGGTHSGLSQFLNNFSKQCVFVERRSRGEGLSALWTAAQLLVLLLPVALNALHTVVVSTRNGHGVPQKLHTDGTAELLLVDENTSFVLCHLLQLR